MGKFFKGCLMMVGALVLIAGGLLIFGALLVPNNSGGFSSYAETMRTKTEAQNAWQQADVITTDSNGNYIGDIPLLVWGDIGKDTSVNCRIERGSTVMVTRFYDDTHPPSAHIRKGSCSGYVSQMQLKWEE